MAENKTYGINLKEKIGVRVRGFWLHAVISAFGLAAAKILYRHFIAARPSSHNFIVFDKPDYGMPSNDPFMGGG